MKNIFKYWLPLYLYACLIFYASSISKPLPVISIPHFDKFLHLIEYAVFGILAARAFKSSPREALYKNFKILAILTVVAYGSSDEFHQFFTAYRAYDILDLAADFLGGITGVIFYGRYHRF